MAARQREEAEISMLCLDCARPLDASEREELARCDDRRIAVLTKCDAMEPASNAATALRTSSITGQGIDALRAALRQKALGAVGHRGHVVAGTAARCAESIRLAGQCLRRAREVVGSRQDELAAAELRAALEELGKVIGAVYTDDVLDRIFSRFCIGK